MLTVVLSQSLTHPLSLKLREVLTRVLDSQGPTLASFDQAESLIDQLSPRVLVLVLSPSPDQALQTLSRVRRQHTGVVLAVGPTADPKLILRALHEGADHYLDEGDVGREIEKVLPRLQSKEEAAGKTRGQVISVLAAAGGSGGSTLAVNLAVTIASERRRCALIDLKPGVGDLAALLDLKPTHTLADLCSNPARLDHAMLEKALLPHSSGVQLLAPPHNYDDIRLLTIPGIQKTLNLVRETFPFVVIDQEDCFHEEQMMTLRQADRIVLVARLDFTALRNARRILDYLGQISIPPERIQLVINRYGLAKELPPEEVEAVLKTKIAHLIPDDPRSVNAANNTGVPVVLKAPTSKVARCIQQLGKSLMPGVETAPAPSPSKSGLRWLVAFR